MKPKSVHKEVKIGQNFIFADPLMCVLYIQFAFVYSFSRVFWECVICFLKALESVLSEEVLSYSDFRDLGT